MLAKVCLKRFRFVLYAALFFLITLHITDRTNSGLIATICIWFALPLAFIAFVWWIYACIRDIVRFFKSGAVPEDAPTWAERAVWWVQDELAEIASLDDRGKVRFFLFRVGGVALAALGLVLIVRDSIVLGTMLLIGGLALCVSASPQSVNRNSPDIKMLACPEGVTAESICNAFADVDTPLGKPYMGKIKTISSDAAIWGPNVGGEYIYLYASKNRRYLHLSSNAIPEWITSGTPDGQKKDEPLDMPELLADLCDCIENYLKTGTVEGVGNVGNIGVPPQTPPET